MHQKHPDSEVARVCAAVSLTSLRRDRRRYKAANMNGGLTALPR